VAIAVGTEKEGLTDLALEAADAWVRIPMVGRVNSLNAATAAAVVVYEAVRQRSG
jgi:TrmH family RNA methyltransferase